MSVVGRVDGTLVFVNDLRGSAHIRAQGHGMYDVFRILIFLSSNCRFLISDIIYNFQGLYMFVSNYETLEMAVRPAAWQAT